MATYETMRPFFADGHQYIWGEPVDISHWESKLVRQLIEQRKLREVSAGEVSVKAQEQKREEKPTAIDLDLSEKPKFQRESAPRQQRNYS